ncbi:MAG: MFS transporter [Candidatus Staskawiczbacteria bacterium]|jgi:MFS family permease
MAKIFKPINKVIKVIIYWDIVINSAFGLLAPVFAIFLTQKIAMNDLTQGAKIAGFASLSYWITKSILQIPIGHYLDKNHGEKDDFWFSVIGTFIAGLAPFGYLISSEPWHIYLCQVVFALGMSMVVPSAYAIFTRHIDKGKESYEWGLDSTLLGAGMGITGATGGILMAYLGFHTIFILTGVFTICSAFLFFLIKKEMTTISIHIHEIPPSRPF